MRKVIYVIFLTVKGWDRKYREIKQEYLINDLKIVLLFLTQGTLRRRRGPQRFYLKGKLSAVLCVFFSANLSG